MVDKYDKKGREINQGFCVPCDCGHCVINIAKSLREAAADAYEDAANMTPVAYDWLQYDWLQLEFEKKARALREKNQKINDQN